MCPTRRVALLSALASLTAAARAQESQDQRDHRLPIPPNPDEDQKLPNGKSQKDAIAKEAHEQALKDAKSLVVMAEQLRDELEKAGDYVVPLSSLKRTEEIEKLAKRIRGKLRE